MLAALSRALRRPAAAAAALSTDAPAAAARTAPAATTRSDIAGAGASGSDRGGLSPREVRVLVRTITRLGKRRPAVAAAATAAGETTLRDCYRQAPGEPRVVRAALDAAAAVGDVDLAHEIVTGLGKPSVAQYSRLLSAHFRARDLPGAFGVFSDMQRAGIAPNLVVHNQLLSACASDGQQGRGAMVLERIRSAGHTPDEYTYAALIKLAGKSSDVERVKAVWEEATSLFKPPAVPLYRNCVNALALCGDIRGAEELLAEMGKRHQAVSEADKRVAINSIIGSIGKLPKDASILGGRARINKALDLVAGMETDGPAPDEFSYNSALWVVATAPEVDYRARRTALDTIAASIEERGIRKSSYTFNALLKGRIVCMDQSGAEAVLRARLASDVPLDLSFFNVLLEQLSLARESDAAMALYDLMRDKYGITPNQFTFFLCFRALLLTAPISHTEGMPSLTWEGGEGDGGVEACATDGGDGGSLTAEDADEGLDGARDWSTIEGLIGDLAGIADLPIEKQLSCLGPTPGGDEGVDPEDAGELSDEGQAQTGEWIAKRRERNQQYLLRLDQDLTSVALPASEREKCMVAQIQALGDNGLGQLAFSLLEQRREVRDSDVPLPVYNAVMHACACTADTAEDTFRAFEILEADGKTPDSWSFRALLQACAMLGDLDEMQRTLEMMLTKHVEPNREIMSVLVRAAAQGGDPDLALEYALRLPGLVPDPWAFDAVIKALDADGRHADVFETFQLMTDLGVIPTASALRRTVGAVLSRGDVDVAMQVCLYAAQCSVGWQRHPSYRAVHAALVDAGRHDDAQRFAREMEERGFGA